MRATVYRIESRSGQQPGSRTTLKRHVLVPFVVTLVLGCIGIVPAQELSQEWRWCAGLNGASADLVISGCTTVIQSGRENTKNLAGAFYNRGNAYSDKGELDRAIRDYDQAIRLNPQYALAFNNRGNAYNKKGEPDRAIQDFDEAIRLNPQSALAFYNRGNAHRNKHDLDRAIRDYDQAIRLDPQYAEAFGNRAIAYSDKGDLERAIQDHDQTIRLNPHFDLAFNNRGNAYNKRATYTGPSRTTTRPFGSTRSMLSPSTIGGTHTPNRAN
jgi:tetratricopeptide (TPR) repeat protein